MKSLELSTKKDIERVLNEIVNSREKIMDEVAKIPDSLPAVLAESITSPLKEFISQKLSSNQAVKQVKVKQLSTNQALDRVVSEMKERLEMLSQRHIKVLNILAHNRDEWLAYEEIGKYCSPEITGSCIRGYVSDLINSYNIPIEKKNFGRKSKVRLPDKAMKELAIARLSSD